MNSRDKISVIMPCYNAEAFIAEAIESVLRQTHRNLELIVVDDGSSDKSRIIIQSFDDERIRYIYQNNRGQCAASNRGLAEAKGDYIKFFDADDWMNEEHLEAQLARIAGEENALASCAWGRFYDGNEKSTKFIPEDVWQDMAPLEWIKRALRQKYDMMSAWLWLIPRKLLQKSGGWDERLSLNNDFEFSVRLLLNAERVLFAADARMYYRSGMASALSQEKSRSGYEAAILATKLGCDYLIRKENSAEMRLLCANRYQEWLFRIYPNYRDLQIEIQDKIKFLGGSTRKMDGGKVSRTLSSIFGWRTTKLLQLRLKKLGYSKLPFN